MKSRVAFAVFARSTMRDTTSAPFFDGTIVRMGGKRRETLLPRRNIIFDVG